MPVNSATEQDWIARHFGAIRPASLGVAVSGGSDSLALMLLAGNWARAHGVALRVATVNHGLRTEAKEEIALVGKYCDRLGLKHDTLMWQGWAGQGNLQAEARNARYSLLADWGHRLGLEEILVGHTQDDQAETFLLRLMRKSGVEGLAAMQPRFQRHGQLFGRPLLCASREDLRAILTNHGVDWCEDASNEDVRFDRVRARKALVHLAPLGLTAETLSAVSQNLASARAALEHFARLSARGCCRTERGDVVIARSPFLALPDEIRHRILGGAILWISGGEYPPRADALYSLGKMTTEGGKTTLAGCLVTIEGDVIRLTREAAAVKSLVSETPVWDRWQISGAWQPGTTVRVLSETDLATIPNWREVGLPRASLLASPAVYNEDTLVAAPHAGFAQGYTADLLPDRAVLPLLAE